MLVSFSHMSASNKISMLMVMVAILSVADEGAGSEEGVTDEHALLQMNFQTDLIDEQKKEGTMDPGVHQQRP